MMRLALILIAASALAGPVLAQQTPPAADPHAGHDMADMPGMDRGDMKTADMAMDDMAGMDHGGMVHTGLLGAYPMTRDASGTAWQPDNGEHSGLMLDLGGGWMGMVHGDVTVTGDKQSGPRGDESAFVSGMIMGMASRDLGPGHLTLRAMVSPDPFMGKRGYPRLFQTGETADGVHPLIDRQHPHDAVGELSATYAVTVAPQTSVFVYAGYPGEPALGPAAYLHRASGMENPMAPISHHWLDSTHVAFGVATVGAVWRNLKLEGSSFTGREPDQYRWDFDTARFDSSSVRLTFNPTSEWSMQASRGWIKSPEQLEPDVNQIRTTASATWRRTFNGGWIESTAAWGQNHFSDQRRTEAYIAEATLALGDNTFFARWERAGKDELFAAGDPLAGKTWQVSEISGGYVRYVSVTKGLKLGLGAAGGVFNFPSALKSAYGSTPYEAILFVRLKIA